MSFWLPGKNLPKLGVSTPEHKVEMFGLKLVLQKAMVVTSVAKTPHLDARQYCVQMGNWGHRFFYVVGKRTRKKPTIPGNLPIQRDNSTFGCLLPGKCLCWPLGSETPLTRVTPLDGGLVSGFLPRLQSHQQLTNLDHPSS